MGDSSSFSSLFALVDNHLSKSNIDESQPSTSGLGSFKLPTLGVQRGLSDTGLPSTSGLSSSSMRFPIPSLSQSPINNVLSKQMAGMNLSKSFEEAGPSHEGISPSPRRFPIPSLSFGERPMNNVRPRQMPNMFGTTGSDDDESDEEEVQKPTIATSERSINDVLAIQLSNMFKAREAREEEEKRRQQELEKVEEKMEESSCLIDLMPAVQIPGQIQNRQVETLSSGSSLESLNIPVTLDNLEDDQQAVADIEIPARPVSPLKPITTDMSYILKHKIGKCSPFGKVLCARYRPVAAPYFREYVPTSHIKVFDFSTPSPDDLVLERLRKPSFYNNSHNSLTVYD